MLHDQADHVRRARRARNVHDGAAAVAALHGDQALGLEDAEGFAQRRAAHLELVQQLVLRGQGVAVLQLAAHDPVPQDGRHQVRQPGLPHRHLAFCTNFAKNTIF